MQESILKKTANLSKLSETLSSIHKDIKFAMEQHDLQLPFTDMIINKGSDTNKVWMDIFCKKTDTRSFV